MLFRFDSAIVLLYLYFWGVLSWSSTVDWSLGRHEGECQHTEHVHLLYFYCLRLQL